MIITPAPFSLTDRTGVTFPGYEASPEAKRCHDAIVAAGARSDGPTALAYDVPPRGIMVGTFEDLGIDSDGPILVMSHRRGIIVAGRDEALTGVAVDTFLWHLGRRQLAPGGEWTLHPELGTAEKPRVVSLMVEQPPYRCVRVFYGYGAAKTPQPRQAMLDEWMRVNYPQEPYQLRTGHVGLAIAQHARFAATDSRRALIAGGTRTGTKLCLSSPEARQAVIEYVRAEHARIGATGTISIEPSDGVEGRGAECVCPACAAMGSPSDRLAILAAEVRRVVPEATIAFLAYGSHASPPRGDLLGTLDRKVIVSVATSFTGALSEDDIATGWRMTGATIGRRKYGSIWSQDYDRPRRPEDNRDDPYALESFDTMEMSDSWPRLLHLHPRAAELVPQAFLDASRERLSTEGIARMANAVDAPFGAREMQMLAWVDYLACWQQWRKTRAEDGIGSGYEMAARRSLRSAVEDFAGRGVVHSEAWRDDLSRIMPGDEPLILAGTAEPMPDVGHIGDAAKPLPRPLVDIDREAYALPRDYLDIGEGRRVFRLSGSMTVDAGLAEPVPTVVAIGQHRHVLEPDAIPATFLSEDHTVQVTDNGGRTSLRFAKGSFVSYLPGKMPHNGRRTSRFFVETDAEIVLWHSVSNGSLVAPDGTVYPIPKGYSDTMRIASQPGWWILRDVVGEAIVENPGAIMWLG